MRKHRTLVNMMLRVAVILAFCLTPVYGLASEPSVNKQLPGQGQPSWVNLVAALRSILWGGRNADVLCERLGPEESMIVEAILRGIEDPETLNDLIPEEEEE